jgi:hypothetical protein
MTVVTCITVFRTGNEGLVLLRSANIKKQSSQISNLTNISQNTPSNIPQDGKRINGSDLAKLGSADYMNNTAILRRNPSELGLVSDPNFASKINGTDNPLLSPNENEKH